MKRIALAAATLLAAFAAQAQIYQWQDENNKTVMSDRPPLGKVKGARQIEADAPPEGGTSGKTLADREMEFRKREKESREGADQAAKDQRRGGTEKGGLRERASLAASSGVRRARGDARQQGRTLLSR
jgi:hypothetical protein